jgi:hypothetical protein
VEIIDSSVQANDGTIFFIENIRHSQEAFYELIKRKIKIKFDQKIMVILRKKIILS